MKEGTCGITRSGMRYCKRNGRVRFTGKGRGTSGLAGRKRKSTSGKRRYTLGELKAMGISSIQGTPGSCMTATRSKGGTQKVCFGKRGRFVTPGSERVAGLEGRRRTRRRRSL